LHLALAGGPHHPVGTGPGEGQVDLRAPSHRGLQQAFLGCRFRKCLSVRPLSQRSQHATDLHNTEHAAECEEGKIPARHTGMGKGCHPRLRVKLSKVEQVPGCHYLSWLVSSGVISHTDVNRAIVVQVVKDQECGFRPQGPVKGDSDARLQHN